MTGSPGGVGSLLSTPRHSAKEAIMEAHTELVERLDELSAHERRNMVAAL